jgi:hypothetical protein
MRTDSNSINVSSTQPINLRISACSFFTFQKACGEQQTQPLPSPLRRYSIVVVVVVDAVEEFGERLNMRVSPLDRPRALLLDATAFGWCAQLHRSVRTLANGLKTSIGKVGQLKRTKQLAELTRLLDGE